jgi:hypothetical protein
MPEKGYHNILTYSDKTMKITANVVLYRLTSENVVPGPKVDTSSFEEPTSGTIFARQRSTGKRVKYSVMDKTSGNLLEKGYARVWINVDGDIVDSHDIEYYQMTTTGEKKIRQYPATLGADRVMKPKDTIPASEVNQYLIETIYEINGKDPEDDKTLYELGKYMDEKNFAVIYPFVIREGWKRYWAIVVPNFNPKKKKFNLLAYIIRAKVEYQHWEDYPAKGTKTKKEKEEVPTLEDDSPF